jgi:hypothetical protein
MVKYHINAKGEAGKCSATQGGCPFGDAQQHYASAADARASYEANQATFAVASNASQAEAIPFRDVSIASVHKDAQLLADALSKLYEASPAKASWIADETYSCDGGTAATVLLARRLGMDAKLHVGLYQHSDLEIRAAVIGLEREDETDEEWEEYLEEELDGAMDEHHHWATLTTEHGEVMLFDPNGAVRDEEYVADLRDVEYRYLDGAEPLVYNPDDDVEEFADELYPGLIEAVDKVVASKS